MINWPKPERLYDAYVFDLDGTVTLGDLLLPTAGETVRRVREQGRHTVFLSNNLTRTSADYVARSPASAYQRRLPLWLPLWRSLERLTWPAWKRPAPSPTMSCRS